MARSQTMHDPSITRERSAGFKPPRKRRRAPENEGEEQQGARDTNSKTRGKPENNNSPWNYRPPRPKKHAVNPIKKRIRDLQRLLAGVEDLPADVRIGAERELAESEQELRITEAEIEKQETISRYHMVRFFDRQKATRRLKKLHKALSSGDDPSQISSLEQQLHIAKVDLNYALYFPLDQPYPSLWPNKKDSEGKLRTDGEAAEAGIRAADQGMWKIVERCTQEGTLEALRNGAMTRQLTLNSGPPQPPVGQRIQRSSKALQKKSVDLQIPDYADGLPKSKKARKANDGEESDGAGEGFFDEEDGGVRLP